MTLKIANLPKSPHEQETSSQITHDSTDVVVELYRENILDPQAQNNSLESSPHSLKKRVSIIEVAGFESSDTEIKPPTKKSKIDLESGVNTNKSEELLKALVEGLCSCRYSIEIFMNQLKVNGLEFDDRKVSALFFEHVFTMGLSSVHQNNLITEFLCYLAEYNEIPISTAQEIMNGLKNLPPKELISVLTNTKKGAKFEHFAWSDQENKYVLKNSFFVPLFLQSRFKNVSVQLVSELAANKNFETISSLLHCRSSKEPANKWIQTPFGLIESLPLIDRLIADYQDVPEIQDLLKISTEHFTTEAVTLSDFFVLYEDFIGFKTCFESLESDQECLTYLLELSRGYSIKDRLVISLTPLGFFYLIPTLNNVLLSADKNSEEIDLVQQFLLTKVQREFAILSEPELFKMALPLFESLIETGNFEMLEKLLRASQREKGTPLFNPDIISLALPLLYKLLNIGQFEILERLLSEENDNGDTPLHHNIAQFVPLLAELVQRDQVKLVTDLITLTNLQESTPIHTCNTIFQTCDQLILQKLERKGQTALVEKLRMELLSKNFPFQQ